MQDILNYNWNEIFALIVAVVMGSGAYIVFVWKKNKETVNLKLIIIVLVINLFFTNLGAEVLKKFGWGEHRTIVLPIIAYFGQYFADWVDKTYPKLFNAGARKMGLDIDNTEPENTDEYEK